LNTQTGFNFFEEVVEKGDKQCIKCLKFLPKKCFSKRGGENYLRTECKECNKQLVKAKKRLKAIHGSAPKNHKCPICGGSEKECEGQGNEANGAWVLDHCHQTDNFRGWLCHKCNRGLGAFKDSIPTLYKAIDYLKQNETISS
tara:strand:+ start:193 stop:621 length:429 start_codon:yes stop_codon:yes gene_type:complete